LDRGGEGGDGPTATAGFRSLEREGLFFIGGSWAEPRRRGHSGPGRRGEALLNAGEEVLFLITRKEPKVEKEREMVLVNFVPRGKGGKIPVVERLTHGRLGEAVETTRPVPQRRGGGEGRKKGETQALADRVSKVSSSSRRKKGEEETGALSSL